MKKIITLLSFTLVTFISHAEDKNSATSKYNCIEINLLTSKKKNTKTRALKRAAKIPHEVITNIQNFMVDEIDLDDNGLTALAAENNSCKNADSALALNGVIVDYKKGNRAVRYLFSFGAGKQKIEANLILTEKKSSKILAQGRVVDRKIAGFVGGSSNKGKRDFAEKVNKFIHKGLNKSINKSSKK